MYGPDTIYAYIENAPSYVGTGTHIVPFRRAETTLAVTVGSDYCCPWTIVLTKLHAPCVRLHIFVVEYLAGNGQVSAPMRYLTLS